MSKKSKRIRKGDWRDTPEYHHWREAVIKNASGHCVICGSTEHLEAHHIKHATWFIAERFKVSNGVSMCKDCHTQFHTNFKRSFRVRCDDKDWHNFLELIRYLEKKGLYKGSDRIVIM